MWYIDGMKKIDFAEHDVGQIAKPIVQNIGKIVDLAEHLGHKLEHYAGDCETQYEKSKVNKWVEEVKEIAGLLRSLKYIREEKARK